MLNVVPLIMLYFVQDNVQYPVATSPFIAITGVIYVIISYEEPRRDEFPNESPKDVSQFSLSHVSGVMSV